MSMIVEDDEVCVTPWIGPTSYKKFLSVMVVSFNEDVIAKISAALTEVHSKGTYKWKLITLRAPHLAKVLDEMKVTGNVAIDFVILALDTSQVFCVEWAKSLLLQIHPDLRRRRVILVNAQGVPIYSMAVGAEELLNLQDEYNLDMISANIFTPNGATFLARRLLKYLEVTVGFNTGLPNLNV